MSETISSMVPEASGSASGRSRPSASVSATYAGVVDLVVDVRDVDDELRVEALVLQEPLQQCENDIWASVADVDAAVYGRPTGIYPDLASIVGLQLARPPAERVMDADGGHRADAIAASCGAYFASNRIRGTVWAGTTVRGDTLAGP